MKYVRVSIVGVIALFAVTGLFLWYVPLPSKHSSSSFISDK